MPKDRKPKTSYSCAPCKRLKIKCDHGIPCGSCSRNNRQDECLKSPAKTLTQFKELIRPNASFGRITKPTTSTISHSTKTKKASVSSTSSIESCSSPLTSDQNIHGMTDNDLVGILEKRLANKSTTLDDVLHRNIQLQQQNEDLIRQLGFYFHVLQKPTIQDLFSLNNDKVEFLKRSILETLPPKNIITILKNHYLINIDYSNHVLHIPSFEKQYELFWQNLLMDQIHLIDLDWLALLFIIISLALVYSPSELIYSNTSILQYFSLDPHHQRNNNPMAKDLNSWSTQWFNTSRQLLVTIRSLPSKPSLIQLQTQSLIHSYLEITSNSQLIDETISQSLTDALALNLSNHTIDDDKNTTNLEVELKRRLWWDICSRDTLRALEMNRTPLIMSYRSRVPFPTNCNDLDINDEFCIKRNDSIPTDSSYMISKFKLIKVLNKIFEMRFTLNDELINDNASVLSKVIELDEELLKVYDLLPWFLKLITTTTSTSGNTFELPKNITDKKYLFQLNSIHTSICTYRFKIYQNFMELELPIAEIICLKAVKSMFESYKKLKEIFPIEREPFYLIQLKSIISGSGIQSIITSKYHIDGKSTLGSKLSFTDKEVIKRDLNLIGKDVSNLITQRVFYQDPILLIEGSKVLNVLKEISYNETELDDDKFRRLSDDTALSNRSKMRVDSLINGNNNNNASLIKSLDVSSFKDSFNNNITQLPSQILVQESLNILNNVKQLKSTNSSIDVSSLIHQRNSSEGGNIRNDVQAKSLNQLNSVDKDIMDSLNSLYNGFTGFIRNS